MFVFVIVFFFLILVLLSPFLCVCVIWKLCERAFHF